MDTIASKQVYRNPWMSVREDVVRRQDGSSGVYGVVESSDIALVVPMEGNLLHLVEQYRHPIAGRCWEFPSGSADPRDSDAWAVASRELREETGLIADEMARLGTLDVCPSTLSQRCVVFLATELKQCETQRESVEQDMRSSWFRRGDVERMMRDGSITDGKTIAAYTLLMLNS